MFCPIEPLHRENRPSKTILKIISILTFILKIFAEKKVEEELFGTKRSNLNLTQSKALKMLDLDYDNFEFVVKQGRKDDVRKSLF